MTKSKYNNVKITDDGITFDSKAEHKRYTELRILSRAGLIHELTLQPRFELQPSFKRNGKAHRAIHYIADFQYLIDGRVIIEDVKGMKTAIYELKKKLFLNKYGHDLEFSEVVMVNGKLKYNRI